MQLPFFQSSDQILNLLQTKWRSILNPLLANPISSVSILSDIKLNNGTTVIPHKLGRVQQGWFLVDIQGAVTEVPYRSMPFNELTLTLISNAAVTVSIGVF